jgi:copper chaperone CopZ
MKKGFAFMAVIIVAIAVAYISFNWKSDTENAAQANQEVALQDGGTIELTKDEASLTAAPGEKKVIITDIGMFCTGCRAAVAASLKKTDGVKASYVNLALDRATVVYDPTIVSVDQMKQRIIETGYRAGDVKEVK